MRSAGQNGTRNNVENQDPMLPESRRANVPMGTSRNLCYLRNSSQGTFLFTTYIAEINEKNVHDNCLLVLQGAIPL